MKYFVLIIDDDDDIYFFLSTILKKKDIRSVHARSLEEGKSRIRSRQPPFIFLDNQLPDGSGIGFLPQLRILAPDAVIIAMTALLPEKSRIDAFYKGADYFLEKPFSKDQINDLIEQVLHN
jgi:DNA-binding response OmpR family regulator